MGVLTKDTDVFCVTANTAKSPGRREFMSKIPRYDLTFTHALEPQIISKAFVTGQYENIEWKDRKTSPCPFIGDSGTGSIHHCWMLSVHD